MASTPSTLRRLDARWCGLSPLDSARTAASSPRNDFVKNYRVHPTHWLICAQVGYSDWDEVASYQSWSPLKSKGTLGGAYSYIDATVSEGEWLYRIVAEQSDNSRAIVCQVGVSVENSGQQLQTKLVVGGFAALVLGALAAGALLDPIKG